MTTPWFRYDFGYSWPFTVGHLLVFAAALALTAVALWRGWRPWIVAVFAIVAAWGIAGAAVMHQAVQINEPVRLPTDAFLPSGRGRVVDLGAGSGRATIGMLLARPNARVTAIDLYRGYFGIDDNTEARLKQNAALAGVGDRVEVRTADMRQLPFGAGEFDAATSVAAIDHLAWPDIEQALREVARVLKPGGQFLVVSLNSDRWVHVAMPFSMHGHGYWGQSQRRERWRQAFAANGFDVTEVGTGPATLYWLVTRRP
jgi:SAM-dependent methyltransferase